MGTQGSEGPFVPPPETADPVTKRPHTHVPTATGARPTPVPQRVPDSERTCPARFTHTALALSAPAGSTPQPQHPHESGAQSTSLRKDHTVRVRISCPLHLGERTGGSEGRWGLSSHGDQTRRCLLLASWGEGGRVGSGQQDPGFPDLDTNDRTCLAPSGVAATLDLLLGSSKAFLRLRPFELNPSIPKTPTELSGS